MTRLALYRKDDLLDAARALVLERGVPTRNFIYVVPLMVRGIDEISTTHYRGPLLVIPHLSGHFTLTIPGGVYIYTKPTDSPRTVMGDHYPGKRRKWTVYYDWRRQKTRSTTAPSG